MRNILTTREAAEELGTEEWRVRRLYEDGDLLEPERFAGARAIPRDQLGEIAEALRARGWLPAETAPNKKAAGYGPAAVLRPPAQRRCRDG